MTCDAGAEAARSLPIEKRSDFGVIRCIATAEYSIFRAKFGKTLPIATGYPSPKSAGTRAAGGRSIASTILVDDSPRTRTIDISTSLLDAPLSVVQWSNRAGTVVQWYTK